MKIQFAINVEMNMTLDKSKWREPCFYPKGLCLNGNVIVVVVGFRFIQLNRKEEGNSLSAEALVWTEEDRRNYFSSTKFPGEPLLPVEVDAATQKTIEEVIDYDGKLTRVIIRFLMGHMGLVSVRPFINEVPLIDEPVTLGIRHARALVGDGNTFELLRGIKFSKGDKARVEIKNHDQYGHIPGIRFFTQPSLYQPKAKGG